MNEWIPCSVCRKTKHKTEFVRRKTPALCAACRRQERVEHHSEQAKPDARNTHKLSTHRKQWPWYGEYAPPFKAGTSEYVKWYRRVLYQAKRDGCQNWPEYFAKAKAEAFRNPPIITLEARRKRGLFGGADTPEYRHWYHETVKAARRLNIQHWPNFFAKAKAIEMRRQGLVPDVEPTPLKPMPEPSPPVVNTLPLGTPYARTLKPKASLAVPPTPSALSTDAPLMFDFALPEDRDEGWR